MLIKMQQRRGLAAEWLAEADTVILSSGEVGLETDTGKFKIGNGTDVWSDLDYVLNDGLNAQTYAKLNADQTLLGTNTLSPATSSTTPLVVDGASGQSASLQSWSVAGTEVASLEADGSLSADSVVVAGKVTINGAVSQATDAVTKAYVDANTAGLDIKQSVRAATTSNISLTGEQTIDGVSIVAGDRVLVKDQTNKAENGIYVASASTWSRSSDADADAEINRGLFTFSDSGTQNSNTGWVLITLPPYTLGTTDLEFTTFSSGVRNITAGAGITNTGNIFDVVGTADRITVNADSIDIASTYSGQSSITTVGTVISGAWEGTKIDIAHGGTGATTAADARTNLSVAAASHTHSASDITNPSALDVGKINGKKISVQSSAPTSPSDGDLWFY